MRCADSAGRILGLSLVKELVGMVGKDVGLYHLLLAKVSVRSLVSLSEKKEALECIVRMVVSYPELGKLLTNNIKAVLEVY